MKTPYTSTIDKGLQPLVQALRKYTSAQAGMTLMEITVTITILSVLVGILLTLGVTVGDVSATELARTTATDEARRGIEYLTAQLRNASLGSLSALPANAIGFQVAQDVDGNGSAVDHSGNLELGPVITVSRDTSDVNHDGVTTTQLLLQKTVGGKVTTVVLANNLLPDEDANGNKTLDAGEDTNRNGALDHGVWFERVGNAIRITLQTEGQTRRGNVIAYTLTEMVLPRN